MKLGVSYYNDNHQSLLERSEFVEQIRKIVASGVEIDDKTMMVYMLFTEQKPFEGFRDFRDIEALLPGRISEIEHYFDFSGGTLRARFPSQLMENQRIERAGVGAALVAMNMVAGLHHADWEKIEISQIKDLDFRHPLSETSLLASNGATFLEVEAKGSVVENVDAKQSVISHHRKSIEEKKEAQRSSGNQELMFGVITAIPTAVDQLASIRLLDPPGTGYPADPTKYRLLARLLYYRRICSYVTRLQMLPALSTRIASLAATDDYTYLDGMHLLDWTGRAYGAKKWTFRNKSLIPALEAVGHVYPISFEEFAFHGHAIEILNLLANQRFEDIVSYSASKAGTHEVEFDATISRSRLSQWGFLAEGEGGTGEPWRLLRLNGDVTVLRSGFVFGRLKIAE